MAQDKLASPDAGERTAAMTLGKASLRVSLAGIIVGFIFGVIYLTVFVVNNNNQKNHNN